MTPVAPSGLEPTVVDAIRDKLQDATVPLKLADVVKNLPRPKKLKAPEFKDAVAKHLEEEVHHGRAFRYPSGGKTGEPRFWARDEKHLLREKAEELAATPLTLAALKTAVGKAVAGTDGAFIDAVLRELIAADKLFEHPAKKAGSAALFGAAPPPPPPPPLLQPKHGKALTTLVASCQKLLTATGADLEQLFQALRERMAPKIATEAPTQPGSLPPTQPPEPIAPEPTNGSAPALNDLILQAVEKSPVLSLADLRQAMPPEHRGADFDRAVFHLADDRRVILGQDADPTRFTDAERAEYVQEGGSVFTTISKWS